MVYILQRPGSAALRTLPDELSVAPPTMECTFSLLYSHTLHILIIMGSQVKLQLCLSVSGFCYLKPCGTL